MGRKDTIAAKSIRKMYEQLNLNAQQKERSGYVESPVVEENEFDGGRSRRILRNRRI